MQQKTQSTFVNVLKQISQKFQQILPQLITKLKPQWQLKEEHVIVLKIVTVLN